jgi:hypothetical protein
MDHQRHGADLMGAIQQVLLGLHAASSGTTWNTTDNPSGITRSNGNLTATAVSSGSGSGDGVGLKATTSKSSGKWYFEVLLGTINSFAEVGIAKSTIDIMSLIGLDADGWGYILSGGGIINDGNYVKTDAGSIAGAADVIGVACNFDDHLLYFSKNGTYRFSASPGAQIGGVTIASGAWFPAAFFDTGGDSMTLRCAAADLSYSPPSGYTAWNG